MKLPAERGRVIDLIRSGTRYATPMELVFWHPCRYLPFHSAPLSQFLFTNRQQQTSFVSSKVPAKGVRLFESHHLAKRSGIRHTRQQPMGTADARVLFELRRSDLTASPIAFVTPPLAENHKGDGPLTHKVCPPSQSRNVQEMTLLVPVQGDRNGSQHPRQRPPTEPATVDPR